MDDALASGDVAAMRAALAEIKRRGAPYLQWSGKAERTSFEVDTVSLHVHKRIDPMNILSALRKELRAGKDKAAKSSESSDGEKESYAVNKSARRTRHTYSPAFPEQPGPAVLHDDRTMRIPKTWVGAS